MSREERIIKRKKKRERKKFFKYILLLVFLLIVLKITNHYIGVYKYSHDFLTEGINSEKNDSLWFKRDQSFEVTEEMENYIANAQSEASKTFLEENRENLPKSIVALVSKNEDAIAYAKGFIEGNKKLAPKSEDFDVKNPLPYFLQWDRKWGYVKYGDQAIGTYGCAPTSLAMILKGLGKDVTPIDIAKFSSDNGFLEQNLTSWKLFESAAQKYGVSCKGVPIGENLINILDKGSYILVSVKPGVFTDVGHLIVLSGIKDGKIIINDPNSPENSKKLWTQEEIKKEARAMWVFSK